MTNNIKRCLFFRYKKDFFSGRQTFSNDICNCLTFTGTRWPLEHKADSFFCKFNGFLLA